MKLQVLFMKRINYGSEMHICPFASIIPKIAKRVFIYQYNFYFA
jgi:hypothetical protein